MDLLEKLILIMSFKGSKKKNYINIVISTFLKDCTVDFDNARSCETHSCIIIMNLLEILISYKKRNDELLVYKGVLVSMIPLKSLTLILYQVLLLLL